MSEYLVFMKYIKEDKTDLYYTVELELQSVGRTAGGVVLQHQHHVNTQHRLGERRNVIISL